MTIISTVMAMLLGIPLGVVLVVTSKGHILENVALNKVLVPLSMQRVLYLSSS